MPAPWVSPWWQAACLPKRWDVAGIIVPSLSVWHTFALENVGNAYLCGGTPDRDAAASLLLIASRNRANGLKLMASQRALDSAIRRIHRSLRGDWKEIDAACVDYVATCIRSARRWTNPKTTGKPYRVPYQFHIVRVLSKIMPYDAAWDFSYAEGRCNFDAQAEADGDDLLMSPEQEQKDDEIFEQMQAAKCQR